MNKIGFIGIGNMGGTLAKTAAQAVGAERLLVSDRSMELAGKFADAVGCTPCENTALAAQARYIFLGVKPQVMGAVLGEIAPILAGREDRFVLVSMAAGLSVAQICEMAGGAYPVIRIMPNTPAAVGCGMIVYCANQEVSEREVSAFLELLAPAGRLETLPEALIDAASAVSGCGPAFGYLFIEALADGAVACGLPRQAAQTYAAQTVLGAAQMVLSSGAHPGALKDAVCSPGGSTIAGVHALEKSAFRAAAQEAVLAAYKRTVELGK
ncbi:MAG: pyrroline-5-carboxylate reductase [Oscillospiraceae bacterium]|jgi:pyrroline-5-carboxylate reductase|nr:pyrroline-5-carboxylate reductase [Oscillospiraceae bacterium]